MNSSHKCHSCSKRDSAAHRGLMWGLGGLLSLAGEASDGAAHQPCDSSCVGGGGGGGGSGDRGDDVEMGAPRAKSRSGSLLSVVSLQCQSGGQNLLGTFPCCDTDLVGAKMVGGFEHARLKKIRASNIILSRYLAALTGLSYVSM